MYVCMLCMLYKSMLCKSFSVCMVAGGYNYIYGASSVSVFDFLAGITLGSIKPYFLDCYLGHYTYSAYNWSQSSIFMHTFSHNIIVVHTYIHRIHIFQGDLLLPCINSLNIEIYSYIYTYIHTHIVKRNRNVKEKRKCMHTYIHIRSSY
jgi:hypothetical protein